MDNALCTICGRNRQWHKDTGAKHQFTDDPDGKLEHAKSGPPVTTNNRIPGDPILRFLLIEKGLITPEDLTKAEEKLRAVGSLVTERPPQANDAE